MDFTHGLKMLSLQFVPFVMAVVLHEYAHGWMANRFGDTTAKDDGRLTMNPLPHLDMLGTLVFPIINMVSGTSFLIGWAKPVPINPTRFKKYRPGLFWVSFAGPLMNFLLGLLSAALLCALVRFAPQDFYLFEPLLGMAKVSVSLNFALGFFNLIPLPPLDGSKIIESFLPYHLNQQYEKIAPYSFFILMGLLLSGAMSVLSYPISFFSNLSLFLMANLFGLTSLL